ncbi:MAG: triose-phosphate isomerase [Sphingomonadales bacterium]|jgi:triosephosphate isomerase
MTNRTPIVAGNWKMNGLKEKIEEISLLNTLVGEGPGSNCEVLICPPFTLLMVFAHLLSDTNIKLGAQDCHWNESGPHTGDISPEMLKDAGCSYVIVGHSERRSDHGETNKTVKTKAEAVLRAKLKVIVCVGETELERDTGNTLEVVISQVKASMPFGSTPENTVIAYEPLWAIGTGRIPSQDDVIKVHTNIRANLIDLYGDAGQGFRILYGGSVKPSNAIDLMSTRDVDGALVGGASLKADDFNGIIEAYRK